VQVCSSVVLPLISKTGARIAELQVALLPGKATGKPQPLVCVPATDAGDESVSQVQLLEGAEYRYVLLTTRHTGAWLEPREVFQPDTEDGLTGRVRPGLFTGSLKVALRQIDCTLGEATVEVRSRKLNYLSEYRWMLSDIANHMTELVMDRFGASSTQFVADESRDAVTLYQRFAFLKALVSGPVFETAIGQILRRPHVVWEEEVAHVVPGQPLRGGSGLARALARPGPRSPWPNGIAQSLPRRVQTKTTEATHDTTPNRFVRFALERWLQVIDDIERALLVDAQTTFAVQRGLAEVRHVAAQLQALLHEELFSQLGQLDRFPADDQVLQKRDGYRDFFRAYTEFELASKLSWTGGDDVYGAGQRDVATLYEYWVFVVLAKAVASLIGASFDLGKLIVARDDGLSVHLKAGKELVLSGIVSRMGRELKVELCFNRRFGRATPANTTAGSWSMAMRPDYTLIVTPAHRGWEDVESVLLHFDAKYRVNGLTEIFGSQDESTEAGEVGASRSSALRDDLLKMHAYRDAIRRSAGAYVIYPGDDEGERFPEFHELLPGLGAFALRPTEHGDAAGISALTRFISEVLDHVATRLTAHERGRQFLNVLYDQRAQLPVSTEASHVHRIPDETSVMLGWVKSVAHWEWICKHRSYNVRAFGRRGGQSVDARLLFSQIVLLYGPGLAQPVMARVTADPQLFTEPQMVATGYPQPQGEYLCLAIQRIESHDWLDAIDMLKLKELALHQTGMSGAPAVFLWREVSACRAGN